MTEKMELLAHSILSPVRLLKPGGMKVVMAETIVMIQQLIVMGLGNIRSLKLTTSDGFLLGLLAFFIRERRLHKVAVIVRSDTILSFHEALVIRRYCGFYSNNSDKGPGRKGQDQALIDRRQLYEEVGIFRKEQNQGQNSEY